MTLFEKIVKINIRIDNASTEEDISDIIDIIKQDERLQTDDMLIEIKNMIEIGINYSNFKNKELLNVLHKRLSTTFEYYFANNPYNWNYPAGIKLVIGSSESEKVYENCENEIIEIKQDDIVSIYDKDDKMLFNFIINNHKQPSSIIFYSETSYSQHGSVIVRPYCSITPIHRDLYALEAKEIGLGEIRFDDEPEVVDAIRNDDLDYLQKFVTSYEFEPYKAYLVSKEAFQQYPLGRAYASRLMDIILLFGAVKCFKYLYSVDRKYYEESDENCFNLIVGGSIEIFKILENEHRLDKFIKNIMIYSIIYHKNDVAKYLILNNDINKLILIDIITSAVEKYNFDIVEYLIKEGFVNINDLLTTNDFQIKAIRPLIKNISNYINSN